MPHTRARSEGEREAHGEGTGFEEATCWWFKWHFGLYFIISFIPFSLFIKPSNLNHSPKKRKKIVRHSYKCLSNEVTQLLFFFKGTLLYIVSDWFLFSTSFSFVWQHSLCSELNRISGDLYRLFQHILIPESQMPRFCQMLPGSPDYTQGVLWRLCLDAPAVAILYA